MNYFINDLQHEILSFLNWNDYYEICIVYNIPVKFRQLFRYQMPTIYEICDIRKPKFDLVNVCKYVLDSTHVPIQNDMIYLACKRGHLELLKFLEYKGDNPTRTNMLLNTIDDEQVHIIEYFYNKFNLRPQDVYEYMFAYSCQNKKFKIIKFLHEKTYLRQQYENPNNYDKHLHALVGYGDPKIIKWLNANGYKNERCIIL